MNENTRISAIHTRLFSSLVQVVENQLFDMENYLQRPDYPHVLNKWENDLAKEQITLIRQQINLCYQRLRPFAGHFALREQSHGVRNAVITKAALLWEILENGKSKRIKGSGEMDADNQRTLDLFLDEMINSVNVIIETLDKEGR
jgi:hypothetical protein